MKVYKLYVDVKSTFLTYPKGDMIYGFFLYWWDKFNKSIENIKEKIVFSDFLPDNYFKKPHLEFNYFTNNDEIKKEIKSISWIYKDRLINGNLEEIIKDKDFKFFNTKRVTKNHLNYITFSTSSNFSPYVLEEIEFIYPVVLYIATSIDIKEIVDFLNIIGEFGFGKKSNIGKGVFEIIKFEEYKLKKSNAYLALSPFITKKQAKYQLFTRYGKFHLSNKAFKNPIVLMDSASVVLENCDIVEGMILEDKTYKKYFIQAKSIMLPFKLKKWQKF